MSYHRHFPNNSINLTVQTDRVLVAAEKLHHPCEDWLPINLDFTNLFPSSIGLDFSPPEK